MVATGNEMIKREDGIYGGGPVKGGIQLFSGTLAFIYEGWHQDVVGSGCQFAGIVRDYVDARSFANGGVKCNTILRSSCKLHFNGIITNLDLGKKCYALDNNTLTLSDNSGANPLVGVITEVEGTEYATVALQPFGTAST